MKSIQLKCSILLVMIFGILLSISALDEESAKELKCFVPPNGDSVQIDYEWVLSNKKWYFPILSKLEWYRTAWDLLQKPVKVISEDDMNSACIRANWEGLTPTILGFNGKQIDYTLTPMNDNTFIFTAAWRDDDGGTSYFTKSDNKNYIVFVKCWDDGQASWSVMSTSKTLEPVVKAEVLEHVKSLGFKEEFFIEEKYESCNLSDKNEL